LVAIISPNASIGKRSCALGAFSSQLEDAIAPANWTLKVVVFLKQLAIFMNKVSASL